jgi:hypothetical protein
MYSETGGKMNPLLRNALLLALYTAGILVGAFATACILGAPLGVPMLVISVKRGWKLVREI